MGRFSRTWQRAKARVEPWLDRWGRLEDVRSAATLIWNWKGFLFGWIFSVTGVSGLMASIVAGFTGNLKDQWLVLVPVAALLIALVPWVFGWRPREYPMAEHATDGEESPAISASRDPFSQIHTGATEAVLPFDEGGLTIDAEGNPVGQPRAQQRPVAADNSPSSNDLIIHQRMRWQRRSSDDAVLGPFCPEDNTLLGWIDALGINERRGVSDETQIGPAPPNGQLFCPTCGGTRAPAGHRRGAIEGGADGRGRRRLGGCGDRGHVATTTTRPERGGPPPGDGGLSVPQSPCPEPPRV